MSLLADIYSFNLGSCEKRLVLVFAKGGKRNQGQIALLQGSLREEPDKLRRTISGDDVPGRCANELGRSPAKIEVAVVRVVIDVL